MSDYETLRHFADSWGLVFMGAIFLILSAWPFLPGARDRNRAAATMIFDEEQDDG
ncbi:MAG: cbb3-type cytochrome c oxidase subunit 3 [Sphingobium sp.]|nr:cbb3-type cytochrome c oxidase subunit 3 [Sphingobium sp.]MBP6111573.1 cbb3-type cytochrome c oxidase subunit 3 [Sphingobium sp.]MBP8670978.1 cbb3-type cytochrome c oxidase subunit 3 [Sphingobium sp.]MBP9158055.1 cbb3-type cytochrome c oxidase subunit 3 [Sphingobium sp.]MCC6481882.1 cbb3-type cytochrome c oxidase subunit 3 [Sphingomonadaceae bacterium]